MEVKLQSGEQIVDLERNGYKIIQNRERFCFGMDAVLLTGFAKVGKGERALDLGTGTVQYRILELFQYYLKQKQKDRTLKHWKFSLKVLKWQEEALCLTTFRTELK